MLSILSIIPGLFTTVNGITNAIANEKIAALNATTDQERIAAQERVTALQAQRDVLIADSSHSNVDQWMRTIIASGPAYYLTKVFIWDYSLGLGSTPNITPVEWNVVMVVVGFYFVATVAKMFR